MRVKLTILSISLVIFGMTQGFLVHAEEVVEDARLAYKSDFQTFIATYCVDCHSAEEKKAELNLEGLMADGVPRIEDQRIWRSVIDMLGHREMPPSRADQPGDEVRFKAVDYLEATMETFQCSGPANPGRVTIRRLNRAEYENTIRDLIGVDFNATEDFPRDEVGYGFDNIGDVLSISPVLMERYLDAAEEIVNEAILSEVPQWPPVVRFESDQMKAVGGEHVRHEDRFLGLYREGEGQVSFEAPEDGEYRLRIRARQDQAGPEPARMEIKRNGNVVGELDVASVKPKTYEVVFELTKGAQELALGFTNNYNSNDHPDESQRGDRNLHLAHLEVEGPMGKEAPPLPESHTRVIDRQPEPGKEMEAAKEMIGRFMARAYRRPASEEEVNRLAQLVDAVMFDGSTFEEGMKVAVQAILISPHFLFRWELDPREWEDDTRPLNDYELASRLSYFLWSSMPDDNLFDICHEGRLQEPEVLNAQIKRMLQDPRSSALVSNFAGQWLQIRNMDEVEPDPDLFPEFDDELRTAMRTETELFFQSVVEEDRNVLTFLDADYSYLNERLAKHYGIEGIAGSEFRRVALDSQARRGGILTQGSILTITSNPTRTSPVNRGKWVLEQILGTPPPPPPPDVEPLEESTEAISAASLRERMELHRANPDCAGCHAKMDPIGLALENFDAIGRWRDMDGKFPIDSSSELPGGIKISGFADLKNELKGRQEFLNSLAEKMLIYALGRGTEYYDQCVIDELVLSLKENEYRFSSLIIGIVNSEPFRKRKLENPS